MNKNKPKFSLATKGVYAGLAIAAAFAALSACGGGDDSSPAPGGPSGTVVPPDATALVARLSTDMTRTVTRMASLEAGAVFIVNPGFPLTPNMTGGADLSPGSPANTFTFTGKYDGNGNGQDETTVDGRVSFVSDPTAFDAGFNGAQGSLTLGIDILGLLHVYRGNMSFSMGMTEHRVSGGGTFTNPATGATTTVTVDPAAPLTMKRADGSAGALPNACAHSLNGAARISVAGSAGTLSSVWGFAYDRSAVTVTSATFTDTSGKSTSLPDSQVDLGCGGTNSINEWNGRFRIQWACLPRENGEFITTISVKNGTTLTMIDDGDSAADAYEASLIGPSARAIRGFFIDGPVGSRYREDFNWTLNLDGSGFSQTSRYVYFEGPQIGKGGICVARATRIS